jgi:hypothetical protein
MRAQRGTIGSAAGERVNQFRYEALDAYLVWIETAKSNWECSAQIPIGIATAYFEAQSGIVRQMQEKVND